MPESTDVSANVVELLFLIYIFAKINIFKQYDFLFPVTSVINKDPILIPVCYQCENKISEDVHFMVLGDKQICSKDCVECAMVHDLLTASECSKKCQGIPTFCYPVERLFDQRKCYQATYWYGCKYAAPTNGTVLTEKCKECASLATNEVLAQECSAECDGLPTYRMRDRSSTGNDKNADDSIVQCIERPTAVPGEFFYYDIPKHIARHTHVSNPGNIYPAAALVIGKTHFSGKVGKRIFRKFNMGLLTWPRPPGYEKIKT